MLHIYFNETIQVPTWVEDLESFRRWAHSDAFPERGSIAYCGDNLWIEASMETLIHNKAKIKICTRLETLSMRGNLGHVFGDGMRLTHPEARLSCEPDLLFVSHEALQRQRVQVKRGPVAAELIGSPDMVLEVVSTSSVHKDTVILKELYWKAGILEYWLVDPRGSELSFEILRYGEGGYEPVKERNGWRKSIVFGRSFRLTVVHDTHDLPVFTLEVR